MEVLKGLEAARSFWRALCCAASRETDLLVQSSTYQPCQPLDIGTEPAAHLMEWDTWYPSEAKSRQLNGRP